MGVCIPVTWWTAEALQRDESVRQSSEDAGRPALARNGNTGYTAVQAPDAERYDVKCVGMSQI